MPFLIDGYNLLKATMPPSLAGLDEPGLCHALQRAGFAADGVSIICDGAPKPGLLTRSPVEGVELIYAGKGVSADDVIVQMIETDTAPRRFIVVSSDREIAKAARRRRARAMTSAEFIRMLAAALAAPKSSGPSNAAKRSATPLPDEDVQHWLKEFGVD